MEIALVPYNRGKRIKKLVWVHQLYEQVFDEDGKLLEINLVKGYTNEINNQKKQKPEKKKLEIKFEEEVEER